MNQKDDNVESDCLVFLHIPKSAGTTFGQILQRQYPRKAMEWVVSTDGVPVVEMIQNLSSKRKSQIAALMGHFDYGVHCLLPRPARYVTFVRHPVDRVLSQYYYVLRTPHHYLHHEVVSNRIDLKAYVSHETFQELENGQTRMIAGPGIYASDEEMLQKAIDNIQSHFSCVGTSERFVDALILMAFQNGWKHPYYRDANVGGNKPLRNSISEEIIGIIEKRNTVDMELYRFVNQRLEEQLQATLPDWKERKQRFLKRNHQYVRVASFYSFLRTFLRGPKRTKVSKRATGKRLLAQRSSRPDTLS